MRRNRLFPSAERIAALAIGTTLLVTLAASFLAACTTHPAKTASLRVISHAPPDPDQREGRLEIAFDRPFAAATEVGATLAAAPVRIEPAIDVQARWIDRQTLAIEPRTPLSPSTRYRVTLVGELHEQTRGYSFEFVHRPLVVEGIVGLDAQALGTRPTLPLLFNQPVAAAEVAGGCRLRTTAGTTIGLSAAADAPTTSDRVVLEPSEALETDTAYTLRCEGLIGFGGDTALAQPYELPIKTHPTLQVVSASPDGDDVETDETVVELSFSTPVELEIIRAALTATPKIDGLDRGALDGGGTIYRVVVDLAPRTTYRVELAATLADVHGQVLGAPYLRTFETGDARPRLSLETGIYAVEPSQGGYPVWSRNVSSYDIKCAAVPTGKLAALLTSAMDYDPWYDAEDVEVDWKALGIVQRKSAVKVAAAKDKWHLDRVDLAASCGKQAGERGVYLAEFSSSEVKPQKGYEWRHRPSRRVLANVTNLGVLLKAGPASGLVWVTQLSDGAPVAGAKVALYSPAGKRVFSGTTDNDGLLRTPGSSRMLDQPGTDDREGLEGDEEEWDDYYDYRAQRLIAVIERGKDVAVVDGNWSNGIQTWNFGIDREVAGGERRVRGFIQSDRGIYRPGETVGFKGIVREIGSGSAPAVPTKKKVRVTIESSRGDTVLDEELRLSAFGGFAFSLPLTSEAAVGGYYVRATLDGQTFRERFLVEEFRPTTFSVALEGGERHLRRGDRQTLQGTARYYFGAPVAGAQVDWQIEKRSHALRFPGLDEYAFADYAARGYWSYWDDDSDSYASYLGDGTAETDAKGHFAIKVADPNGTETGPVDYLVSATVTDASEQSITKQIVLTAHASDLYVGLHSQEFVQAVGMPFSINTVAVDPQGKRVATSATMELVRQRWNCKTRHVGYRNYQQCDPSFEVALTRSISIPASGTGTERIYPTEPGEFIVRLKATDARGNQVTASSYVWILGKGEAFWSGDESARMALIASKTKYRPGEQARLVPRTNLQRPTALVTVERNGILSTSVRRLQSASDGIELAIEGAHAPNVFVSVAMVSGRHGDGDGARPRFQLGMTELEVDSAHNRLTVAITTDKPSYQPGEQVSGTIRVTSSEGAPMRSEVSLSVADEGVLALVAYKTPDPMKTFYARFGLGVENATNWNRIARLNDPTAGDPDEGGDGGDAEDQRVRSNFVSSAYWAPSLITDEAGLAPFTFTAPDNLTEFRMMAVAADTGARFGSGEHRITVSKPLLAQPVLPRFASVGDSATVGVLVFNRTGAAGTVTVSGKASGASLAPKTQTVRLADGESKRISFATTIADREAAAFEFGVRLGAHTDRVRIEVPVHRALDRTSRSLAESVLRADQEFTVPVSWDATVRTADSALVLTLDRTGLGAAVPALRYLIEYPYGCLEQTLSKVIPMAKVGDLARSLELAELKGARLDEFMRAGLAKVARHQHADGHFSLWPSGSTYPHLTAYALYGLTEAKRGGYAIDESALERGLVALAKWATAPERKLGADGESSVVAMAAYLLAVHGRVDSGLNARLHDVRAGLDLESRALLLRALIAGKGPVEFITELERGLVSEISVREGRAFLALATSDDLRMRSDLRAAAIVASALLDLDNRHPHALALIEGIKQRRNQGGSWRTTQDNLYALVALADYARVADKRAVTVAASVAGRPLEISKPSGQKVVTLRLPLSSLTPGALVVKATGTLHLSARLEEVRDAPAATPLTDRGLRIERSYRVAKQEVTSFAAGDLIEVELRIDSDTPRRWIAVADALPAGFEPINEALATEGGRGNHRDHRWTHTELRDDRALAFADYLRAGRTTFSYRARATLAGTFVAAPARVEAMYQPDTLGTTAAASIVVKP